MCRPTVCSSSSEPISELSRGITLCYLPVVVNATCTHLSFFQFQLSLFPFLVFLSQAFYLFHSVCFLFFFIFTFSVPFKTFLVFFFSLCARSNWQRANHLSCRITLYCAVPEQLPVSFPVSWSWLHCYTVLLHFWAIVWANLTTLSTQLIALGVRINDMMYFWEIEVSYGPATD